jgi:chlorophyllide a reductase subunit X
MDFLGDVVCGGFATPLSRSLAEEVIILCGNDRQSLYAANNIASAAKYFAAMGGQTKIIGLVINRDDGSGVAERFAEQVHLPVLARIPLDRRIRELADACQLALVDETFDGIFSQLAEQVATRSTPPVTMDDVTPLEYDAFLNVFGAAEPAIDLHGARADDLFQNNSARRPVAQVPVVPLEQVAAPPQMDDATSAVVSRLAQELGLYVTQADHDPRKGLVLTVDGNVTLCLGSEQELDSKLAILAALRQSGEHFTYVDLRRPAAPMYR